MGRWLPAYAPPVVNEPEGQRDGRDFQAVVGRVAAATDQAGEACIAEANTQAVCRWRRLGPAAPAFITASTQILVLRIANLCEDLRQLVCHSFAVVGGVDGSRGPHPSAGTAEACRETHLTR